MSDVAIVTGASSGIGLGIAKTLCRLGYEVFGFGRNFDWSHKESEPSNAKMEVSEPGTFHKVSCDLLDTAKLEEHIRRIKKEYQIKVLVNNAGTGYYGLHEELNPAKIREMARVNLEVPMVLTNLLLRDLKKSQGTIINISSVTATSSNPHGCAYGATKAGLTSFSHSLFDEARKYGVKVVNIQPDMARTNLYRNADFTCSEEEAAYLLPEDVAEAVAWILNQRQGVLVTDLTIKPQLHRIRKRK